MLATSATLRTFRLPDSPTPIAEVADRFHLAPLIRAMTSPHDVFVLAVLALTEESVRLIHAFANLAPDRLQVPNLPRSVKKRPDVRPFMYGPRAAVFRISKAKRFCCSNM